MVSRICAKVRLFKMVKEEEKEELEDEGKS